MICFNEIQLIDRNIFQVIFSIKNKLLTIKNVVKFIKNLLIRNYINETESLKTWLCKLIFYSNH